MAKSPATLDFRRDAIAGWWLVQPIAIFAYSRLSGFSVFTPRYLSIALPGAALIATLAAGLFLPTGQWRWPTIVLGAGALITLGQWSQMWPPHHNSDWR